jgi:integrase
MWHLIKRGRLYSVRIRLACWVQWRQFPLRTSDKMVAVERARNLLQKLERQSVGLMPPDSVLDAASKAILGQLPAFLADVEARGRSMNTIKAYRKCIPNLCRACGWVFFRDITAESFEVLRSRVCRKRPVRGQVSRQDRNPVRRKAANPAAREAASNTACAVRSRYSAAGVSQRPFGPFEMAAPKYLNDLLGYMRAFIHWCLRRRLIEDDPLKYVQCAAVERGRGYRRAFTQSELGHFLLVVPPHRAAVYKAAYYLGLRRWELNHAKRGDFDLDSLPPVVRIPDTITKNSRAVVLELHPELVAALRAYWPSGMSPFEYAFYGRVPNMETWKRDLGKAAICFEDGEDRRLDFHSLRHTLCTHLRLAGVSKRDAKAIMRVSSESLLDDVYGHDEQLSVGCQIGKLPRFGQPLGCEVSAV